MKPVFNKCLELGYFPNSWKSSAVKILKKPFKDDYSIPKSYRPICLSSNLGKIFERLILSELTKFYSNSHILHQSQHGFTANKSTISALKEMVDTIIEHKANFKVALLAVDISGAFDNAWFPAMIKQLDQHDVPSPLIKIIHSFLSDRKVILSHSNKFCQKSISKGCPQGGIFSPLLWNVLLNEFLTNFNNNNAKPVAFADDITFIIWSDNIHNLKTEIAYCFSQIHSWCNQVKLNISTSKTNILYLHNHEKLPVLLDNHLVQPSDNIKILGVHISNHRRRNKLNFNHHVKHILQKGIRIKNALFAFCARRWGIDSHKRIVLLKAMLRPALYYGAEIWFPHITKSNIRKLDSLQYQIAVRCVHAYNSSPSSCVHLLARIPFFSDFLEAKCMRFNHGISPDLVDAFLSIKSSEYLENSNLTFKSFFSLGIPKHIVPNQYTTLFFTGHGPFNYFLNRIRSQTQKPHQYCSCGVEETPLHLITDCVHTQHIIDQFFLSTRSPRDYIGTKQNYILFSQLCKHILNSLSYRPLS